MQDKEAAILAQKQSPETRNIPLRWLVALSTLPLLGMAVAFGIAPATDTRPVELKTVIEGLALPQAEALNRGDETYWREVRIQRGDTIGSLLNRLQINDDAAVSFLSTAKDAKTLYQLVPGRSVRAKTGANGELIALRYIASDSTQLSVDRAGDTFKADEQAAPLETRIVMKSGEIRSSLFGATDAAGVPDAISTQMAEVFSSDIDFHLDIRKGDHFSVVYETLYNHGEPIKTGRVLAAEFVNQGKAYRAVYFKDREGHDGYYTPEGNNLRKAFLRSPLAFSRITSGFTNARFHPVLKTWRAHKGVDYGAPTGTPVRATADGSVALAGKQSGYGNIIVLQHTGSFSTAYGHLSAFAKGLHHGSRVKQGDVIGYVGMTGMATGPHLHYEFRMAGVQRNPLTVPMPQAFPIAAQERNDFLAAVRPLSAELEMLRGLNLASVE
jgi:murein DD-endopeptidase MepM/ murein hydrolase activator NlpD